MEFKKCLKCNTPKKAGATECPSCGVIYQKAEAVYKRNKEANAEKELTKKKEASKATKQPTNKVHSKAKNKNLIICPACGKSISKNAQNCPNCGEPINVQKQPAEPKKPMGCCSGMILIFLLLVGLGMCSEESQKSNYSSSKVQKVPVKTAAEIKAENEACRNNLQCYGDKSNIAASFACAPYVEKLAKYSHKWTDGWLDVKFSHFRWQNKERGIVTYIGDKVQFQNGFGAWQNYKYECDYNPTTKTVIDVRAYPGRM